MGYQTLIVEKHDAVVTVMLNRPEARNALDLVMRRELVVALDEIEADPSARVVVLTGAGGHFCAGGDVKSMQSTQGAQTAADGRARVVALNRLVMRLVEFPRPVIAMVDGFAVGAGCNLALCCDLIIASDRAKFGEVFARIGLVPDGGGSWLLSRVVGLARAKELIFTADIIDAAEAARIGLVNRVLAADRLMPWALETAETIAANSPSAVQAVKQQISETIAEHALARETLDQELGDRVRASEHFKEGVAAFLEKRAPRYP
jgi:2-(1,2-epoxy-1,2-dihydrophenyl)acetyl-CoA isomerase